MCTWIKQGVRLTVSVIVSFGLLLSTASWANGNGEVVTEQPGQLAMIGDAIFARPLLFGATLLGTAVFVATLPFSVLSGDVDEAADVLVVQPADSLLFRCLGCTEAEDASRDKARNDAAAAQRAVDAAAAEAQSETEKAQATMLH